MTDMDLLASIVEDAGHIAPPANSFTVADYMEMTKARGCPITHNAALDALQRNVEAGLLRRRKFNVGGRQRWVYWPAEHTGDG